MNEYAVNYITSSLHYPQSNGLAEKFVQIVKDLFYKVKEEGADINKYLMIYHNTPLASTSKSPMQMLQQKSARSQLPMSNAARRRLGIAAEQQPRKNQHLPAHDFHIGQDVMCQSPITKRWFPAKNQSLMSRTEKLPDRNTRRDHLQKDTKPTKTIQLSSQKTQMNEQHKETMSEKNIKSNRTSTEDTAATKKAN